MKVRQRWRNGRRTSALVVGLAVSTALAGLAVPANAAESAPVTGGTLDWSVSAALSGSSDARGVTFGGTKTAESGATYDASTHDVSFSSGVGQVDADGTGTVQYRGTFTSYGAPGGSDLYGVRIADPTVVVNADGTGEITAAVSAADSQDADGKFEWNDPADVAVVTLSDAAFTVTDEAAELHIIPDWSGVLPAGSSAADQLGIPAGQPIDGQAFTPDFLAALPGSLRGLFYASGSSADEDKAPEAAVAVADLTPAQLTASVGSPADDFLPVNVIGSHLRGVTEPSDAGVYLGVAPTGDLPDVSSPEGMGAFAQIAWLPADSLHDGTVSTTLSVPLDNLDAGVAYSLFSWQAHRHSNTTQDTQTPLGVLVVAPSLKKDLPAKTKTRVGTKVKLKVKATGADLTYQWQRKVKKGAGFSPLKGETSRVLKFRPGNTKKDKSRYRVIVSGAGASTTSAVTKLRIKKAKAKVSKAKLTKKKVSAGVKAKKRAKVKVAVKAKKVKVRGKVRVVFKPKKGKKAVKKKVTKKLAKHKNKAKVKIRAPKLAKGVYKVKVKYLGKKKVLTKAKTKAGKLKIKR